MTIAFPSEVRRDRAELKRLLDILFVLASGFGIFSIAVGTLNHDRGAFWTGLILIATGLTFAVTRVFSDRTPLAAILAVVAAGVITACVGMALVQPIYPAYSIAPLLGVGAALPYVRGHLLVKLFAVTWISVVLTGVLLENDTYLSNVPPEAQSIFRVTTLAAAVGVLLLQLTRFSGRLHAALDKATTAELAQGESEARYRVLVERLACVVYRSSRLPTARVDYVSPQVHDLLGYTPEEWTGDPELWCSLIHADDRDRIVRAETELDTNDTQTLEYRIRTRGGRDIWVRDDRTVTLRDGDGKPRTVHGTILDISDQKRLELELAYQAYHDPLTGMPNRRLFSDRLSPAIARARRSGHSLAVVYLDLDDFKTVNDTLGHEAGDALLIEVARRLSAVLRTGDTASRVGGDEFLVLLEDLDNPAAAEEIAARLLAAVSGEYTLADREVRVTASAGGAALRDYVTAAHDLQRQADVALYKSKSRGKACITWFEDEGSDRGPDLGSAPTVRALPVR